MSKVLVTESYLTQIANAIRSKLGGSAEYRPGDMAAAILSIPTGSNIDVESLNVTQNGTYTAPTGKAYSPVTVNVQGGGAEYGYLNEYNAAWGYTGDNANSSIYYPNRIMVPVASGGTGTWCTTTAIDFTGKTRVRIKISTLEGSYTTMCRLVISARPISNTDRGDTWVVFDNGIGEYTVNLPAQKTAIYVGAMAWTQSYFVVDQITAE